MGKTPSLTLASCLMLSAHPFRSVAAFAAGLLQVPRGNRLDLIADLVIKRPSRAFLTELLRYRLVQPPEVDNTGLRSLCNHLQRFELRLSYE